MTEKEILQQEENTVIEDERLIIEGVVSATERTETQNKEGVVEELYVVHIQPLVLSYEDFVAFNKALYCDVGVDIRL